MARVNGRRLQRLRVAQRLSYADLARAIGVSEKWIRALEHGAHTNPRILNALGRVLHCSPGWLVGVAEEPLHRAVPPA